mmetsp:Transcript_36197/g.101915  ORF Transcript_36197/g.101915 Transcript_36197/m.101915 type:complete len:261 (-) Transcript_36197:499-1281(-)
MHRRQRTSVPHLQISLRDHCDPHAVLLGGMPHTHLPCSGGTRWLRAQFRAAAPESGAAVGVFRAVCCNGQSLAEVHIPVIQSDAGRNVAAHHSADVHCDPAEDIQRVDLAVDADPVRGPGHVQPDRGQLRFGRRLLRHGRHRAACAQVHHAGKDPHGLGQEPRLGRPPVLHGPVGGGAAARARAARGGHGAGEDARVPGVRQVRDHGQGQPRLPAGPLRTQCVSAERVQLPRDLLHESRDITGAGQREELHLDSGFGGHL